MLEYREYWQKDPTARSRLRNPILVFIFVCVCVHIAQHLINVPGRFSLSHYLGLKPDFFWERLWLWQVVSYAFLHDTRSVFHIVFNLYLIWWSGTELRKIYEDGRIIALMLGSVVVAGLCQVTVQYSTDPSVPVIGASGMAMGLLVAFTLHQPRRVILFMFFLPMPLWIACLIFLGIDVVRYLDGTRNTVAHMAHLGGAFFGFLFHRYSATVFERWSRMEQRIEMRHRIRERTEATELDKKVDAILDRMLEVGGFENLPDDDRAFLERASRRYKNRGE